MTRVTLTPLANLSNGTTATTTINANSTTVNNSFDRVLFLDGTQPNQMQAALDMNSNQIINLAPPATMNSPARLVDVASNPTIVVPGTGTSGHLVPFLDGINTWAVAGSNTFAGGVTLSGTVTATNVIPGAGLTNASVTTTQIATNTVANSNLAQMATNTIKGNNTGGTANAADLTVAQVAALFSAPNIQVLTSSGTYTTPANTKYLIIEMVGAGGGGGGSGTGGGVGTVGGNTTFGSSLLTANGGSGGTVPGTGTGGAGGSATGGNIVNTAGSTGNAVQTAVGASGGAGGPGAVSFFGGPGNSVGGSAGGSATGFGSGGAGGGVTGAVVLGTGGGSGAYIKHIITSVAGTYPYAVGAGGGGGAAGTTGTVGGNGAAGTIIVYAYFQ